MKAAIAALLLAATILGVTAPAQAKFTPIDPAAPVTAIALQDTAIDSGPAAAMLESNYFNMRQPPLAGIRAFPCGIQTNLFQKTRLIRACD